ncbi:MAG: hypothetical protein A2138_24005 [Deltaproteobacteria bacterium RBG_16_71_12]|nr:MAG: hypothetical protein A2138_24005 [Deltaproteobacteria bacterium RBG_16_71_12]
MNTLATTGTSAAAPFALGSYTIKRPFLTLFGRKFHVFGPDGQQVMFVKHKILTFKDEWNIYTDESESTALIRVKARQAIGLNIITDVYDAKTGEKVGAVRNKGLKSIVRDTWEVLDTSDNVVGSFGEDSNALLRRFIPILLGHWHMEVGGTTVAKVDQAFRFFTKEFALSITDGGKVDARLAVGCAMLALMRELMREAR